MGEVRAGTHISVLEPAGVHAEVETRGDPLDRQEADLVRRTLKYRCNNRQAHFSYVALPPNATLGKQYFPSYYGV